MTANFCRNCGKPLVNGTNFCTYCGAQNQQTVPNPAAYSHGSSSISPVRTVSKKKPVWIGIAVGFLLIILGVRMPVAMLLGNQTAARIDSVERRIDQNSSQTDYHYDIRYYFYTDDGDRVSGSYSMTHVYNQSRLPPLDSTIQIKYVPGLHFINAPVSQSSFGLGSVFLIVLGVFLVVLGFRGNLTVRRTRYR